MPASTSIPQASVIHWFRRDLRVSDNPSLSHAASFHLPVIPVYFLSSWSRSHSWTGPNRQHFLCQSLLSLHQNLQALNSRLIVRTAHPLSGLKQLICQSHAVAVCFNRSPDPYGKQLELEVEALCKSMGIACHAFDDVALHHPDEVLTQGQQPYKVYTPYANQWLQRAKPRPLGKPIPFTTPTRLPSEPLPSLDHWQLPAAAEHILAGGEKAARARLKATLLHTIHRYQDTRNFPALNGTSRLSQDLRHGLISIRTVYAEIIKCKSQAPAAAIPQIDVFIKELIWREFYFAILHHHPSVLDHSFNPTWKNLPWNAPDAHFDRWKSGTTGFPIVDAGMRELLATGHMHNRVRMITAMFLTKDLHIDWKLGESHFMQHLVDGEIASNNGGWQWSAGTGADAAPYFRIQNPWTQTTSYDPDGTYIKRWIPELQHVHPSLFSAPPKLGKPIAKDYPLPCVNHQQERELTLKRFAHHKAVQR